MSFDEKQIHAPRTFVVFDYDGVIIDSTLAVNRAVAALHSELGLPEPTVSESNSWMGPNLMEMIKKLCSGLDVDASRYAELEDIYVQTYVSAAPQVTRIYPGVDDVLAAVAGGGWRRAIATTKPWQEMDAMSSPLPGLEFFGEFVFAPNNHAEGLSKTALVGQAVAQLRVEGDKRGVMVGDRATDVIAGKAHDLTTVAVLWGGGTLEELSAAEPDHIVENASELRSRLVGLVG